jgi:hypothetical protein
MKKHLILTLEYDMGDYSEMEKDGYKIPTSPDDIGIQESFYQSDATLDDMKIVGVEIRNKMTEGNETS